MASSARIDELLKKFDENPRRYFAPLANEYRKAGDLDRAIQICREHLPQQPGHMSGHIVFGQALFEAQQFDEARTVFEAALALDPENLIALRHLGDIARDHGDVAGAREWYQRVLDADPRNEEISAQIAALDASGAPAPTPDALGSIAPSDDAVPTFDITLPMEPAAAAHASPESSATEAQRHEAARPDPARDRIADSEPLDLEPVLFGERGTQDTTAASAGDAQDVADMPALELDGDMFATGAPAVANDARDSSDATDGVAAGSEPRDSSAVVDGGELDLEMSELHMDLASASPSAPTAPSFDDGRLELEPDDAGADSLTPASAADRMDVAGSSFTEDTGPDLELYIPEPEPEPAPAPQSRAETRDAAETLATSAGSAVEERAAHDSPEDVGASEPPHAVTPPAAVLGLEPMEFVGPPRGVAAPELDEEPSDPLLGHTLRDAEATSATPAAFVTETMAELYLQQGFRDEALGVYRQLLDQNPSDEGLRERVRQLESGRASSVGVAEVSETVIEAAQKRREQTGARVAVSAEPSRGGPNVRAFFASLAARRPATPVDFASLGTPASGSDRVTASQAAVAPSRRYDDFGFPVDESSSGGGAELGYDADFESAAPVPAAEIVGPGPIEPATLDYLTNDLPPSESELSALDGETPASDADAGGADGAFELAEDAPASRRAEQSTSPAARAVTGPVDSLFGGDVARQDESAAATLAGAFGEAAAQPERVPTPASPSRSATPPAGGGDAGQRGTRPAASELSLDHVFRDTPRRNAGQRRETPSFSFDQFFAETASSRDEGGQGGAGAPRANDAGGAPAEGPPTTDIEQFNAWLEGLKKK